MTRKKTMVMPGYIDDENKFEITIPLKTDFRFVHEPVNFRGDDIQYNNIQRERYVGREKELNEFIQRILLSDGGAFLVTGYRGVGKTSFVNRAIHELHSTSHWISKNFGPTQIVDIHLNLAKPITPTELMYLLIRSLYTSLLENKLFEKLEKTVQQELHLAFQRTSMSLEKNFGAGIEGMQGLEIPSIPMVSGLNSPKITASRKRTKSESYGQTYLSYDEREAEYDLIRLSKKITKGYVSDRFLQKVKSSLSRRSQQRTRLKIVFVFDELDKLEFYRTEENKSVIEDILSSLKNLFTASGLTFIFVAGKDIHEKWLEDIGKGDSVYESVFSFSKYLPVMWESTNLICSQYIGERKPKPGEIVHIVKDNKSEREHFIKFLSFVGRGIPRRTLRAFNSYVHMGVTQPFLGFTKEEIRRIKFFSELQNVFQSFQSSPEEVLSASNPEYTDKNLLGAYYLLDWILQQGYQPFNQKDAIEAFRKLNARIVTKDENIESEAQAILSTLLNEEYLEKVTRVEILSGSEKLTTYRISRRRLLEMGGNMIGLEEDQFLWDSTLTARENFLQQFPDWQLVAHGGTSDVFRVFDEVRREYVIIKFSIFDEVHLNQMLEMEGQLLTRLTHPHIVKCFEIGKIDKRTFLVLQYIDGLSLGAILANMGALNPSVVLSILLPIIDAIGYLHEKSIVRCDIKPSNIMVEATGMVYLLDLGIAQDQNVLPENRISNKPAGTPSYMAPEQSINAIVDSRVDIYALGVVMYEMLTGKLPNKNSNEAEFVSPRIYDENISFELEKILLKCLQFSPENRYQTITELSHDIPKLSSVNLAVLVNEVTKQKSAHDEWEMRKTDVNEIMDQRQHVFEDEAIEQNSINNEMNVRKTEIIGMPDQLQNRLDKVIVGDADINTPDVNQPYLEVVKNGNLVSTSRIYLQNTITFGRSSDNDIILADNAVSRYHARAYVKNDSCFLEDLNSANPVFVNNSKIEIQELNDGDIVEIGSIVFKFNKPQHLDEEASNINEYNSAGKALTKNQSDSIFDEFR